MLWNIISRENKFIYFTRGRKFKKGVSIILKIIFCTFSKLAKKVSKAVFDYDKNKFLKILTIFLKEMDSFFRH